MVLVCYGVVGILFLDVHLCKLIGRKFRENGKCKSDRHWLTKCTQRYDGKLRYQVLPMIQRECRMVSCNTEKERKLSLILSSES